MEHLTDVAVFVAVVDAGSFTVAANQLGLARSVISRRVNRLEAELDIRLLHRTTRKLVLTELGETFYARSRRALHELDAARDELRHLQGDPGGRLVISMPMSFGLLHILPILPAFRLRYPKIELDVRFDDKQVDLLSAGVDIAIRIAKLSESSLVARRLTVIRHVVVAAPSYLAHHPAPVCPANLDAHDCLLYTQRTAPGRWRFAREGDTEEIHVTGRMKANNSMALREMLLAGMGIGLIPTFMVMQDLAAGTLQPLLSEWQSIELGLYAVYPTRQHVAPSVRAFIAALEHHLGPVSSPPYWDSPPHRQVVRAETAAVS